MTSLLDSQPPGRWCLRSGSMMPLRMPLQTLMMEQLHSTTTMTFNGGLGFQPLWTVMPR